METADTIAGTHALVVALHDGATVEWEYLTNQQIAPAAETIERAREVPG